MCNQTILRNTHSEIRYVGFSSQEIDGVPSGQQIQTYLPKGEYELIGTEEIEISDRGSTEKWTANRLHRDGLVYYVGHHYMPLFDRDSKPTVDVDVSDCDEISAYYGGSRTACLLYVSRSGWYCVEGSQNVNQTDPDLLVNGVWIEELEDCDYFHADRPVPCLAAFAREIFDFEN